MVLILYRAAQEPKASGVQPLPGRRGGGVKCLQDTMPFPTPTPPFHSEGHRDPLRRRGGRGRLEETKTPPPFGCQGQSPSPLWPRPEEGAQTKAPGQPCLPKGGGKGPGLICPVVGVRVPQASCCIHADKDSNSCQFRQVTQFPRALSFFIFGRRMTPRLTALWLGAQQVVVR